ncbi:MAG: protein kinase [Sandaracinus sp.]
MNDRVTMTPADALIGRVLDGKYRLDQKLGAGAMGAVYKATESNGQPCAVKVMAHEAIADPALRERFEREARALFALRHPNVLEVRDFGVDNGLPYLVMELLQGRTLEEMVVEHTPDPATGIELAKDVLRGLAFAHEKGVLHRDLKTENVFCQWDGQRWRAKLLDFGLVKFQDEEKWGSGKKLTMQGSVFGSPAYMSPEQATGTPMTARSDVYSAGVVLYEMVTGEWPFAAESQVDMLRMHLVQAPPAMETKREALHVRPELTALVQKALAKKPEQRFADAREMLAALEAVPAPAAWIDPSRPSMVAQAQPLPPPSTVPQAPMPTPVAQPMPPTPATSSSGRGMIVLAVVLGLGLVGLMALAAIAYYVLGV